MVQIRGKPVRSTRVSRPFSRRWDGSRLRLDNRVGLSCSAALVGLGLCWGIHQATHRAAQAPAAPPIYTYEARIQGNVAPAPDPARRLTLRFPQIPYQISKRWSELTHPTPTSFAWPVRFRATAPFSECELHLASGQRVVSARIEPEMREVRLSDLSD